MPLYNIIVVLDARWQYYYMQEMLLLHKIQNNIDELWPRKTIYYLMLEYSLHNSTRPYSNMTQFHYLESFQIPQPAALLYKLVRKLTLFDKSAPIPGNI